MVVALVRSIGTVSRLTWSFRRTAMADRAQKTYDNKPKEMATSRWLDKAYLAGVHLELSDDLDGYLACLACTVSGSVYIAEGTIPHFLDQSPSIEPWVLWQLPFALSFLGNYSLDC